MRRAWKPSAAVASFRMCIRVCLLVLASNFVLMANEVQTWQAGSARIKITPEERSTAVRSAKVMGLNVAGVDLLRSNHGPVVMEVNSSPGLEGIENATGKDVAGMIIEFIEKNARQGRTRTRGTG